MGSEEEPFEARLEPGLGSTSLYNLLLARQLCDVELVAADHTVVPAHKVGSGE